MKRTRQCPKCQGHKFWVFPQAELPRPNTVNATIPVVLAMKKTSNNYPIAVATIEAWICAECGFAEWYGDPADIQATANRFSQSDVTGLQWVDATPARSG